MPKENFSLPPGENPMEETAKELSNLAFANSVKDGMDINIATSKVIRDYLKGLKLTKEETFALTNKVFEELKSKHPDLFEKSAEKMETKKTTYGPAVERAPKINQKPAKNFPFTFKKIPIPNEAARKEHLLPEADR